MRQKNQSRFHQLMTRTHVINWERVRCQRFCAAADARRENILRGSLTDEQRCRSAKDWQPSGLCSGRASGCVAPQSQSASVMLLRHALPATRQSVARLFPIYDMGSKALLEEVFSDWARVITKLNC